MPQNQTSNFESTAHAYRCRTLKAPHMHTDVTLKAPHMHTDVETVKLYLCSLIGGVEGLTDTLYEHGAF